MTKKTVNPVHVDWEDPKSVRRHILTFVTEMCDNLPIARNREKTNLELLAYHQMAHTIRDMYTDVQTVLSLTR